MSDNFKNKRIPILLVLSKGMKESYVEDLKRLGFYNIKTCQSCAEARDLLKTTLFGWIISPLAAEDEVNALDILMVCKQVDILQSVCITLMVDKTEGFCLAKSFELGLFSWFSSSGKTNFRSQVELLLEKLSKNDFDINKTAFEYLRIYLVKKKLYKNLEDFETNILFLNEQSIEQIINLAFANLTQNNIDKGQNLLVHARNMIDGCNLEYVEDKGQKISVQKLKIRLDAICQKYLSKEIKSLKFTDEMGKKSALHAVSNKKGELSLSLEDISFCRKVFVMPDEMQSKKVSQYLHDPPLDFDCQIERKEQKGRKAKGDYIVLSSKTDDLDIGDLNPDTLDLEFSEIPLIKKDLPIPKKIKEEKLLSSLKKSWQKHHKRMEAASKMEDLFYGEDVILLHHDYSGGNSVIVEMEKIGFPLVECLDDPKSALDQIIIREIKFLIIWYDPLTSNFKEIYDLLFSLTEIRTIPRVIVLVLAAGEQGLHDFSARSKDLFYDKIAIYERNRSKFRKIFEELFLAAKNKKNLSDILYNLRQNPKSFKQADFVSLMGGIKNNAKRYFVFAEYICYLLNNGKLQEAKDTLLKFKPVYSKIFDYNIIQFRVTAASKKLDEAEDELIENCLEYDKLTVTRIGAAIEELMVTGSVEIIYEMLSEWGARSDLLCNYYFNYLCSLYFKMTNDPEKQKIYLFSCVNDSPFKREYIYFLCKFFGENDLQSLADEVRSFTRPASQAA